MKFGQRNFPWCRWLSGAFCLGIGWFAHQLLAPSASALKPRETAAPAVAVAEAKRIEFNPASEYVGHVEPVQEVDILPQVEGYIKRVCFQEGAQVRVGDVLFEIDDEQYLAAHNLKAANVKSAESRVLVAKAEVDRAERYFTRLHEADDRGVTATDRDTAETTLASAKAALVSSESSVAEAKAALAIAEFNLKHSVVRSPISGRIGKSFHHVGDFVSSSKTPLARVVQTDPIRVVFPVPDRDYHDWQVAAERGGREVADSRRLRLVMPDGKFYDQVGRIDFGDNAMSRETATVVLYVRFANPANRLMANAFVRVVVDASAPETVTAVPSSAIVREPKGYAVWTVGADNLARRRPVEPGATWKGLTVVERGLEAGERVISQGVHKVKDGSPVKRVPETRN